MGISNSEQKEVGNKKESKCSDVDADGADHVDGTEAVVYQRMFKLRTDRCVTRQQEKQEGQ